MKQLATLIFILSSLICSGQDENRVFTTTLTLNNVLSRLDQDPWPTTDEIITITMISIQPTRFLVGADQVDLWIDLPVNELINLFLRQREIDIYKMRVDLSKTKIKNFYYLMIGDDAAHIGRDKKLIVNDTLKAQKILTQALLNYYHR